MEAMNSINTVFSGATTGITMRQMNKMDKALGKSKLFVDFSERVFMAILDPMNVIYISYLRGVCKKFNFLISKHANDFHYFDSISLSLPPSNIHILKIL